MKSYITILVAVLFVSCFGLSCFAACPSADLTGDCKVNFADFAKFAEQWMTEGTPTPILMTFVSINDPGVGGGHEGFNGLMSKYETTNAQYCQYLNAAKASGDIVIDTVCVYDANGYNVEDPCGHNRTYYCLAGSGVTYDGATNGGAARINYDDEQGSFTVDSGFENHPVTYVTWYGATAFCNYYGYRLPTEWEWQAVADYTGSYTYGCGTTITNSMANYFGSTHPDGTTVVGAFGVYGYGMADMAGNVWEWTSYINGGGGVIRGGSWVDTYDYCTVSRWAAPAAGGTYPMIGFRVCR
jgi:formylglycine-generating enzyme required for sulfatase activity